MGSNRRRGVSQSATQIGALTQAVKAAVSEALHEHSEQGRSVAILRNGKVTSVPASELVRKPRGRKFPSLPRKVQSRG